VSEEEEEGETEAKPRSQAEIITRQRELRPRGYSDEPAGGAGLPQAEEVGSHGHGSTNGARNVILYGRSDEVL
jgi:hypothetical protein